MICARPSIHRATIRLLLAGGLYATLGTTACPGGGHEPRRPPPEPFISPRLNPADVVKNLQLAYKQRNETEYAKLLADDFTFCLDPETRPPNLPTCWERASEAAATRLILDASDVSDIRIALTYGADVPDPNLAHRGWRTLRVSDTFPEVDRVPPAGEVITLRVDGDVQDFSLRKGRSPADTLAGSPTAREWFLVAWQDQGRLNGAVASPATGLAPAGQTTTWGAIKRAFLK